MSGSGTLPAFMMRLFVAGLHVSGGRGSPPGRVSPSAFPMPLARWTARGPSTAPPGARSSAGSVTPVLARPRVFPRSRWRIPRSCRGSRRIVRQAELLREVGARNVSTTSRRLLMESAEAPPRHGGWNPTLSRAEPKAGGRVFGRKERRGRRRGRERRRKKKLRARAWARVQAPEHTHNPAAPSIDLACSKDAAFSILRRSA
jgi:hypothetical protein